MARKKKMKERHTERKPAPVGESATGMPGDYSAGLLIFFPLELATYAALALAETTGFGQHGAAPWQIGFIGGSIVLVGLAIVLRLVRDRTIRRGWLTLVAVLWLVLLAARIVPLFLLAGSALPTVLAIFIGELAAVSMVLAAARDMGGSASRVVT